MGIVQGVFRKADDIRVEFVLVCDVTMTNPSPNRHLSPQLFSPKKLDSFVHRA